MKWKSKDFFLSVSVLVLVVLLAGCGSLKVPEPQNDPYLGYVLTRSLQDNAKFKREAVTSQMQGYMEQIAEQEFQRRNKQFRGIQTEKSLKKMEEYVELLSKPVFIEMNQWKGAADRSMGKKERRALEAFWNENKPFSFSGSEALDEWGNELATVKSQLEIDKRKANEMEMDIVRLRREKRFRNAMVKVDELRPYKSAYATELMAETKREAADHWIKQRLMEIAGLQRVEIYDSAHEQQVLDLYDGICDDVDSFGHRDDFNSVFAGWQDLLGENWRRRIVEMGDQKQYWAAYNLAWDRFHTYVDTKRYAKSYRDGLNQALNRGYIRILDNAIRHYSTLASNASKLKNLNGKAFVYSCMAKEMYDFIIVAGWGAYAGDDAETWYKRLSDLETKVLLPTLDERVARRVVIQHFDLDVLGLSERFRQACLDKYVPGNNHAWGLDIVTDKVTLVRFEEGELIPESDDYLIQWNRAEFEVNRTYGNPKTKSASIKTDRIRLIENEDRKNKSSKFYKLKQIWEQEVDLYSLTEQVNGADVLCKMDVLCRHQDADNMFKLKVTNEMSEQVNRRLNSVTMVDATLFLEDAKKEYYSSEQDKDTIPRDDVPQDSGVPIPTEDSLEKQFSDFILKDLDGELEQLIDMYPVELLTGSKQKESDEYLDTLGTVLFYIAKISSADAAGQEAAGKYEWLHLKDQIAENAKAWCGPTGRWYIAGNDEKNILRSLWKECVNVGNEQDGN
ncbi:hypothetical protein P4B35_03280 [Pontiellaceae bacterium B12227]|nr:hypothetical protein [Pontiellaceae bacterium B12227]